MSLLKELNALKEGLSYKNIQIEDHKITADNVSHSGKDEAVADNFIIEGWFDGVVEDGEPPSFRASLKVDIEHGIEDNSFSYTYGSKTGTHSPSGTGDYFVNPYHVTAEKILYTDTHGHRSEQIPAEVVQAYGSETAVEDAIATRCTEYVKSDAIVKELTKYLE